MPSNSSDPEARTSFLPQCGFGQDIDFDSLIKFNRFLFRVYTPKARSPFADDTEPFFVAPRFDELVARSPVDLPHVKFSEPVIGTYADVAQHMEWTTRTSSAYISTSFSFTWAIWEAVRRYHLGIKKDVEIAIMDASALGGRAATAIQLLKKSSPEERNEQYAKWYRFSQDSQSVLVYGMVPRTAVLASVPLLQIIRKMPSYFLRKDVHIINGNPLDQVVWDYTKKKHTYHQFCQEMSKCFMGKSVDVRLRDSTAGAVRLALSFLRPFFHNIVQDDFVEAISYLRTLSFSISQWPGGWWVEDHPEVRQIVEVMVLAIAEELREKYFTKQHEEISRLHLVIGDLEHTIKTYQRPKYFAEDIETESDDELEVGLEELDEPTLVNPLGTVPTISLGLPPSLQTSTPIPNKIAIAFQTPITPPESPRNSLFVSTNSVPFGDNTSTSQSCFQEQSAVEEITPQQAAHFAKSASPPSDELASPPATPPLGTPRFSYTKLPTIVEDEDISEVDTLHEPQGHDGDNEGTNNSDTFVESAVDQDDAEAAEHEENNLLTLEIPSFGQAQARDTRHDEAQDDAVGGSDNGVTGDHLASPFSPHPWIVVRQLGSPLSSRRSSIVSVETLCDAIEFPTKRTSFASASDAFEFVRSPRSVATSSRTVSFSGLSPSIPAASLPLMDSLMAPLPPSSLESERTSLRSRSVSLSSSSSSSSSTASSDLVLPLITPLPPSPVWSIDSLPSSLSRSSSSSPSSPSTPLQTLSEDAITPEADRIIPPKPRISLFAPLSEQELQDQYVAHRRRSRSAVVSETVSYIATGFLVGAFITIFLFSTQRKTMLYVT